MLKDLGVALLLATGLVSPEQGLPSPSAGGITLSSDAKAGAVTGFAVEDTPLIKGCKVSAACAESGVPNLLLM